ncbi:hypothetical protein UCREL1_9284 [Eutypa lata UCREL1]|uniref:Uncharacterized protein n=1 Tax=Eutypa lata (strain UCR-EL1) TaxID=1287681 RepID=M7SHY8_EUTLA|nr:hypothetical protein UCREL1_9284 [Eutypa lata UCREL1]
MDSEEEEEHEARLRSEQRAIGRTPAEHAALETALAQRRRRRQRDKQDSENEYYRVLLQRQRREQQQREQREQQEQQQQRLATYLQQQQQQQQQREQQMRMQAGWLTVRRQQSTTTTTTTGFERALQRMRDRVEAEAEVGIQGPSPPPPLPSRVNAPRRTGRVNYSSRKARGAGWHRRGYRDSGDLWINVREGSYGSVKGRDENENETLRAFVRHVFDSWNACHYPEDWYCDLFFRKRSLIRLLVDLENKGVEEHEVIVRDYFDGGETVYFKVFNAEGEQQSQSY